MSLPSSNLVCEPSVFVRGGTGQGGIKLGRVESDPGADN